MAMLSLVKAGDNFGCGAVSICCLELLLPLPKVGLVRAEECFTRKAHAEGATSPLLGLSKGKEWRSKSDRDTRAERFHCAFVQRKSAACSTANTWLASTSAEDNAHVLLMRMIRSDLECIIAELTILS